MNSCILLTFTMLLVSFLVHHPSGLRATVGVSEDGTAAVANRGEGPGRAGVVVNDLEG